jgi:hypothetical protein
MTKNYHFLQTYHNTTLKNILSSKFIYDKVNDIPKIKDLTLTIESTDVKKSQYLFLCMLCKNSRPYLKKHYKKINNRNTNLSKTHKIFFTQTKKYYIFKILSFFLNKLSANNINTENAPLRFTKTNTKIILWNTPITEETRKLQSLQGYTPNIPLGLNFKFPQGRVITIYQKLFYLRTSNFISFQEIEGLDKITN